MNYGNVQSELKIKKSYKVYILEKYISSLLIYWIHYAQIIANIFEKGLISFKVYVKYGSNSQIGRIGSRHRRLSA